MEGLRRVLIIGDSVACPRPHRGQKLDDTWPVILKKQFPAFDFWQRCRAAYLSSDVLSEFKQYLESLDAFSAIVVQAGITDACPRPFPLFVNKLILKYTSKKIQKQINSCYPALLKIYSRPWVDSVSFVNNLKAIIEFTLSGNSTTQVCIIAIGPPQHEFPKKVPGIGTAVDQYNSLLESLCQGYADTNRIFYVNPYMKRDNDENFIDDGHHLTQRGHKLVADALSDFIATLKYLN